METYEKSMLDKWCESQHNYHPMTGIPMQVGALPALLRPRTDISDKVLDFLQENPSCQKYLFDKENIDGYDWKQLFKECDNRVKSTYDKIISDHTSLKTQAEKIFSAANVGSMCGVTETVSEKKD